MDGRVEERRNGDAAAVPAWWRRPRRVSVVVDNPSWILPYAERFVVETVADGDEAMLCLDHTSVQTGTIAFYLGCVRITPAEVLARNRINLVVHESDLPRGRGFSPVAWQILAGANTIPVYLIEAAAEADSGDILLRDALYFEGHELYDELRDAQGRTTVALCRRYLAAPVPAVGTPQIGEPTTLRRRRLADSELDPHRTIAEQFNLLRVVDNERHPAFFHVAGQRYRLRIEKWDGTIP